MEYLSDRIKSLSVSQTLALAQRIREFKARGIEIISLSLDEPDFNTPVFLTIRSLSMQEQSIH